MAGSIASHVAGLRYSITVFEDKGDKVAEYPVAIDVTKGESSNTV